MTSKTFRVPTFTVAEGDETVVVPLLRLAKMFNRMIEASEAKTPPEPTLESLGLVESPEWSMVRPAELAGQPAGRPEYYTACWELDRYTLERPHLSLASVPPSRGLAWRTHFDGERAWHTTMADALRWLDERMNPREANDA